jgi:hypothetical protein
MVLDNISQPRPANARISWRSGLARWRKFGRSASVFRSPTRDDGAAVDLVDLHHRDNGSLSNACPQLVELCRGMSLPATARVAIDGRSGRLHARNTEMLIEHLGLVGQGGGRSLEYEAPGGQHIHVVRSRQRELQVLFHE